MSIEGKVAAILNERELVINKGSEAGVKEKMKFKVIQPWRDVIKDPDTGEDLLAITREKIRVQIVEVQPKYSIGRTYETYVVKVRQDLFSTQLALAWPDREVTRVRTLRSPSDDVIFGPLDESRSLVNIGDPVVEIEDDL